MPALVSLQPMLDPVDHVTNRESELGGVNPLIGDLSGRENVNVFELLEVLQNVQMLFGMSFNNVGP